MVSIYTSSYSSIENDKFNDKLVSISGDKGKRVNFEGEYLSCLAPKKEFWEVWHSLKDPYSLESIEYYAREYYKQVLSKLNPEEIAEKVKNKILLCYEPASEFCHRGLFASWLELTLGIEVPEIKVSREGKVTTSIRPSYYKEILERVMKDNMDMGKYHCIQAVRLYEKASKLEDCAIKAIDEDDTGYSAHLSLLAKECRENADLIEEKYNLECKRLKKVV